MLARGGRAPSGELRYYVDARLDRFATPLSLAHLGAAASLLGDKPRAELAFAAAMKALDARRADGLRARLRLEPARPRGGDHAGLGNEDVDGGACRS